jgi:AAA family ATP:ADP antiporter
MVAPDPRRLRRPTPDRERLTPPIEQVRFHRWARRVFDVRPHERPIAWTLFGYFFLLGALQHLLKPPRNAYFLSTAGAVNLPWAYIASAVFSVFATLAYARWVAPLSVRRQIVGSQALVAVTLVLFWALLQRPDAWVAGAFYIWIQVFGLLLVSQFFLLGNDLFDPRQAKRIYGFIGAGGLAGGILGAAAAGFLANEIGSDNLLWLGVAMLVGSMWLAFRVFRVGQFRKASRPSPEVRSSSSEPAVGDFRVLRHVPHLQMIALLLFFGVLASTFVDWLYNAAVEAAHPDREEQTEFIGQSFAIFNAIAFGAQLFLVSPVMRYLGLGGALMAYPLGLGLGVGSLLVLPGLWTASVAKGADTGLQYSIDQSAREILYLPIPTPLVQRVKPFIDVVVRRLADGVAGVLLLAGGAAALGVRGLSLITFALILMWIAAVVGVRRSYRRAIEKLLTVRDVDLEEAAEESLESVSIRQLMTQLDPSAPTDRVEFTLSLLRGFRPELLRERALMLLDHPDSSVRAHAIDLLAPVAGPTEVERARVLAEDPDSRVRARAMLLLAGVERNGRLARLESWLDSGDEYLIEAALSAMLVNGDDAARDRASQAVSRLVRQVGDDGVPARAGVARALGNLPGRDPLQRHLETLLGDSHPHVLEVAIASAGSVPRRDFIEPLLPHLEARQTRAATRRALAAYGEPGLPDLAAALRDPDLTPEVRRWLPGVFVEIGTRAAYRTILDGLPAITVAQHRLYALKALNKMRRRHVRWTMAQDVVRSELDRELAAAYDAERKLAALGAALDSGDAPRGLAEPLAAALGYLARIQIERAFRLQGLLYSPRTIFFAYIGLTGGDTVHAAHALELIETALTREDASRLLPLIDPDVPPARKVEIGRQWYPLKDQGLAEDLKDILADDEPWLQAYAAGLAGAMFPERLGAELERLAASGPPQVRPLARRALGQEGDSAMTLSSVDKAAALSRTDLLGNLGADDLLQLAAVAEERRFESGEYLFYEGEEGDYLFVILEGKIRAERGGREVYVAKPGETIGTFSILDREPRSASAVAVGSTSTLALHRADLAQILADNFSLVEGLFAYLTRIIRRMNEQQFPTGARPPRVPE